ncbi:hypothetical protein IE53DRAFT_64836 [Violaceomyces palustris]|uniref:Uncharacterized protein n=1 Tax=Violaceomyces palustris TaxID=1673888 RepID=A0ACD0P7A4_9BASI|nr:hypothetical protein IE53DRAFT_64836 [Violaceomyces palustris]
MSNFSAQSILVTYSCLALIVLTPGFSFFSLKRRGMHKDSIAPTCLKRYQDVAR